MKGHTALHGAAPIEILVFEQGREVTKRFWNQCSSFYQISTSLAQRRQGYLSRYTAMLGFDAFRHACLFENKQDILLEFLPRPSELAVLARLAGVSWI